MTFTIPDFWVGFAAGMVTCFLLLMAWSAYLSNKQKAAPPA